MSRPRPQLSLDFRGSSSDSGYAEMTTSGLREPTTSRPTGPNISGRLASVAFPLVLLPKTDCFNPQRIINTFKQSVFVIIGGRGEETLQAKPLSCLPEIEPLNILIPWPRGHF